MDWKLTTGFFLRLVGEFKFVTSALLTDHFFSMLILLTLPQTVEYMEWNKLPF